MGFPEDKRMSQRKKMYFFSKLILEEILNTSQDR